MGGTVIALPIRAPRASLVWTLALAYLGLALIAALAVRVLSLSMEMGELDRDLSHGLLQRATAEAALQLEADLPRGADPVAVRRALASGRRTVETSLSDAGHKGVLSELGEPVSLELRDGLGRLLGRAGPVANGTKATDRRAQAAIRDRNGAPLGVLSVALVRRPPGARALMGDGFEWPALLVYAAVFGLGSALVLQWTVTRRLRRIARTADAWSAGDFSHSVADPSADEIGQLSLRLDRMARELETLVALQADYAGFNERQRLARELHDTVKQKAFALQLQLAAASRSSRLDPKLARTLEDARGITHEIQEELVELIGGASVPSAEPFDRLLAQRAEAWGRRGGFRVQADFPAAGATPADHRPIVLRVMDEALANVMRHSGAHHAQVRLEQDGGRLRLTVQDDGRGLRRVSEGMGMRNMRERAAALPDGDLTVEPAEPKGVRLRLSWNTSETKTP